MQQAALLAFEATNGFFLYLAHALACEVEFGADFLEGHFLAAYAESTQFIVITHRKGTMEAAHVLHGVTMEESGVSKLLSVKLSEKE